MSAKKQVSSRKQTSYMKHLLEFIDQYVEETGQTTIDLRLVAAWAISKDLWRPQPEDKIKRLARDLSRAARQDYITDDDDKPVRHKQCYKIKQGDVQLTFWVNIEDATREQMRNATQWRRNGVLADCIQLDRDVRHYNKHFNTDEPIAVEFDLSDDVAEKRHASEYQDAPPDDEDF